MSYIQAKRPSDRMKLRPRMDGFGLVESTHGLGAGDGSYAGGWIVWALSVVFVGGVVIWVGRSLRRK